MLTSLRIWKIRNVLMLIPPQDLISGNPDPASYQAVLTLLR